MQTRKYSVCVSSYGEPQTTKWKENGVEKGNTSKALIDPDNTVKEWRT